MGKLRKIGIGFGIVTGIFFALVIVAAVQLANMTPEEKQQRELQRLEEQKQREMQKLEEEKQKKIDQNTEFILAERERLELMKNEPNNEEPQFDPNPQMEKYRASQKLDTEEKVLNFVKNYKGQDNSGPTLFDTLDVLLNAAYPNEDIAKNPSTTGYFIASPDYSRELSDRYWKVEFKLQTYKDSVYWVWLVDTKTNTVYPGNGGAKEILVIMDSFDQ